MFSWSLSGSWITGVLAAVYAVVNRFSNKGLMLMSVANKGLVLISLQGLMWLGSLSPSHSENTSLSLSYSHRWWLSLSICTITLSLSLSVYSLGAWVTTLPTPAENLPTRLFNLPLFSSPGSQHKPLFETATLDEWFEYPKDYYHHLLQPCLHHNLAVCSIRPPHPGVNWMMKIHQIVKNLNFRLSPYSVLPRWEFLTRTGSLAFSLSTFLSCYLFGIVIIFIGMHMTLISYF